LSSDEIGVRYREITSKQEQLMREAEAAMSPR
jgi:DNA primase